MSEFNENGHDLGEHLREYIGSATKDNVPSLISKLEAVVMGLKRIPNDDDFDYEIISEAPLFSGDWVLPEHAALNAGWIDVNRGATQINSCTIERQINDMPAGQAGFIEWQQQSIFYGQSAIDIVFSVVSDNQVIASCSIKNSGQSDFRWPVNTSVKQTASLAFNHTGSPLMFRVMDNSSGADKAGHYWRFKI